MKPGSEKLGEENGHKRGRASLSVTGEGTEFAYRMQDNNTNLPFDLNDRVTPFRERRLVHLFGSRNSVSPPLISYLQEKP